MGVPNLTGNYHDKLKDRWDMLMQGDDADTTSKADASQQVGHADASAYTRSISLSWLVEDGHEHPNLISRGFFFC